MPLPLKESMKFNLGGIAYEIGMYPHPEPTRKDYHRAELRANGEAVITRDYTWNDIREDIQPDPEDYARSAIEAFNKYLAKAYNNDERGYDEIIADFFLSRVVLVGNQLEIKGMITG